MCVWLVLIDRARACLPDALSALAGPLTAHVPVLEATLPVPEAEGEAEAMLVADL